MEELMGLAEIAECLDVSTARAFRIVADHGDFPKPVASLRSGRIWLAREVRAWERTHRDRKVGRPRKKQAQGRSRRARIS